MEQSTSEFIHLNIGTTTLQRVATGHARGVMVLAMLVSDILGVLVSVVLAALVRDLIMGNRLDIASYSWVPFYLAVFVLSAHFRGLYPAIGMSAVEQFRHITIAASIIFLVVIGTTYFFNIATSFSRLFIALAWLFCLIALPFNRTIIRHLMTLAGLWGEPVAVIGGSVSASSVVNYLRRYPKVGLRPEVLITISSDASIVDPQVMQPLIQRVQRLGRDCGIRTAVVVYSRLDQFTLIRESFRDVFERVVLIDGGDNSIDLGGVNVRQYGNLLTFEVRHTLVDRAAQFQKRVIDVLICCVGLLLLSPVLALISLAIAIDSPGGIFYHQPRVGKRGKEFGMLKFRTMHRDGDVLLRSVLAADPARQLEWDRYQKLQDDPRITRIGRFLRRFSLDELPQFINVLVGDMSLVGPRPIMLNQREMYGDNIRHYVRVAPGITGLWQISGRNRTSFAQRAIFDAEYINNWTVWSDIYILIRTVWIIIRRDGAY